MSWKDVTVMAEAHSRLKLPPSKKQKSDKTLLALSSGAVYHYAMIACAIVHAVYSTIFLLSHCYILFIFNLVSLIMYALLAVVIKGEFSTVQATLVFSEICVHSVIATVLFGWSAGFQILLLALVPLSFYFPFERKRMPFLFSGFAGVLFPLLYLYCIHNIPRYADAFTTSQRSLIYIFNVMVAVVPLYIFSSFYTASNQEYATRLSEKNDSLRILANLDPLTGLLNRRSMNAKLENAFTDFSVRERNFSVILGDIDDFKIVNDTYGHDCGDLVLKAIPGIFRSCLREGDAICRWGGEEILILIENSTVENALRIGMSINRAIEEMVVVFNGTEIKVTMTFGISSTPALSIPEMISEADSNLYIGKRGGKNRVIARPFEAIP